MLSTRHCHPSRLYHGRAAPPSFRARTPATPSCAPGLPSRALRLPSGIRCAYSCTMTLHPLALHSVCSPRLTPSSNTAACAISPCSRPSCRLTRPRTMLHASCCALGRPIDMFLCLSMPSHAVWHRIAAVSPRGAVLPCLGDFLTALSFHAREHDVPPQQRSAPQ
ncbi:hypothetical protein DENSPDRAFT_624555 [Dentipellis sp. KUC8613]|nr:hypothetical protein DENSPDRAFT_624555 [Dentipellis sp. KUC8613]